MLSLRLPMKFSEKEFISFVTDSTDKMNVSWLAISGDLLTAEEVSRAFGVADRLFQQAARVPQLGEARFGQSNIMSAIPKAVRKQSREGYL